MEDLDRGVVHAVALLQYGFDGRSDAIAVIHVRDARVQQTERASDVRVAQTREPARAFGRELGDASAHGFDEQQLGEP